MNTENQTFQTLYEEHISINKKFLAYCVGHFIERATQNDMDLHYMDQYIDEFRQYALENKYADAVPEMTQCFIENFKRLWLYQIEGNPVTQNDILLSDEILVFIELGCMEFLIENQTAH